MAGSFPDVPGPRIAYSRNGAIGNQLDYGTQQRAVLTQSQLNMLDSDWHPSSFIGNPIFVSGQSTPDTFLELFFPAPQDIVGWWFRSSGRDTLSAAVQYSKDTTNGIDGTWVDLHATLPSHTDESGIPAVPEYRTMIVPEALTSVRAVRFGQRGRGGIFHGVRISNLHLYGTPSEEIDHLVAWHPDLDEPASGAYFDWGDVRGTDPLTRTFRVKNMSSTRIARSVVLSFSENTDAHAGLHAVSVGGSPPESSLAIGDLAPGEMSDLLTLHFDLASVSSYGLTSLRLLFTPSHWEAP